MARTSEKLAGRPRTPVRLLGVLRAGSEAERTGKAVAAKPVFMLPLARLVAYDNPRTEPEHLYANGYVLIGQPDQLAPERDERGGFRRYGSLLHMALSPNIQFVEAFVRLVEKYESVDREANPAAPQSIVELAEDIAAYGQLEPIKVHDADDGVHADDGGRRICAVLYRHAKGRAAAVIQATTMECASKGERFLMAAKINLSRKQFTPLQEGRVYHRLLTEINSDTLRGGSLYDRRHPKGRTYSMKEAAQKFGVPYGTFRNREALWHPYRVLRRDAEGNVVARRGLTDAERRAVADGTMLPTYASRLSLGESTASVSSHGGRPLATKHRPLSLREMEALFDKTPTDEVVRRTAIAECMRKSYRAAVAESAARESAYMDRLEQGSRRGRRNGTAA